MVRRLRELSSAKGRIQYSSLLLEGTHLLLEALQTGARPSEIVATPEWIEDNLELLKRIPSQVKLNSVTQSVLQASLTTVNPNGVASIFPLSVLPQPSDQSNFVLALDRLQDPGNLGTLFRTALAADVDLVWLALGADPLGQKVLRSSAGAVLKLPFQRLGGAEKHSINELVEKLEKARKQGFQIVGTYSPNSCHVLAVSPYWELDWTKPTVLVLGNEGDGVHPTIQDCCTHSVSLPHNQQVESLNVASAAVPLLLERLRATMTS
ncbi:MULTISPECIES: TrmH family RNA methyltransferase [Prochlorococcus]|uniref:rRNA methylase n=1 Tax=Prochlorococcus marinus (strain SARG / CCMP1375 / SS120) TaxID=167539 RepID=Q7VAT1_PROMA|nr:rRNA methylase [Prochlorococcus marinus subsp. marinus str. CCMP1375]KGG14299.1 TRNA/rRNA methyltransferase (SpoU) [Prochlorococcus marinus str. LG]KGG22128.1 TRNA/rRNA methyltransferase (SpoU) [Prochlorococcus marinus str. SS2]KGG24554.1 TRNA/rRNA methyltransferase (SpoU) [Prochlorococcus marinus str. SS35]KGG33449.1 TRNA/rRNA methyltransferase (SpoU) [Prochlorococcus marinus str. SS51]KGG37365.1 TRNA/rRNA methyltransferase (SpoU) [Prochlorococcus sp. SS52]